MLLGFQETKQLLEKYNLPMAKTILLTIPNTKITSLKEGGMKKAAEQIGFPLVLKVSSTNLLHRTEKNLVKTGIASQEQAKNEFLNLLSRAENNKGFEGILVQEQLQGVELFCGLKQDQAFGSIVMFGLGGIFVEVLDDITFGICPLTLKEAKEMITSLKGKKVLQGFRGLPPVDLNVLTDILVKISLLGAQNPQIKELDFNPIIANGKSLKIADFKLTESV